MPNNEYCSSPVYIDVRSRSISKFNSKMEFVSFSFKQYILKQSNCNFYIVMVRVTRPPTSIFPKFCARTGTVELYIVAGREIRTSKN